MAPLAARCLDLSRAFGAGPRMVLDVCIQYRFQQLRKRQQCFPIPDLPKPIGAKLPDG